jgi:hypothetical protein
MDSSAPLDLIQGRSLVLIYVLTAAWIGVTTG